MGNCHQRCITCSFVEQRWEKVFSCLDPLLDVTHCHNYLNPSCLTLKLQNSWLLTTTIYTNVVSVCVSKILFSCLFNATSMAMIGNEDLAMELWWRTALEMIDNKDHYNTPENTQAFQHLTSSYDESIYDYLSLIIPIFIHSKH